MTINSPPYLTSGLALFLLYWVAGCAGNFEHVDLDPKGVGFQSAIPKAGTRVVVWGNHAAAVDEASMWLHQQGLTVLDRTRLQQGFNKKEARLTGSSKDWAHILEAGDKVGADLVTFVEVSNIKGGQKFSLSQVRSAPSFALTVEIRGVKPKTGEIVTKSKAWQSSPTKDTDMLIEDLTARALDWAWKPAPTEFKVIASPKKEVQQVDENREKLPPTLSSGGLPRKENFTGNGSEKPLSIVETQDKNHESRNDKISVNEKPGSVISSQTATGNQARQVIPLAQSPSLSLPNEKEEIHVKATTGPELKFPASTEMETRSMSSNEIDSANQDELESYSESEPSSDFSSDEVGPQVASGALSILYTPVKIIYAGLGGIFGGFAYVLTGGEKETTDAIWAASIEGDYYLTPAHLKGETPLRFVGPSSEQPDGKDLDSLDPFIAHSSAAPE